METALPPELAKAIAGTFIAEAEARGRAEGEARGRADGEATGEARGRLEAKREMLLRLLAVAGLETSSSERERIAAASEADLDLWIARVVRARSADELFRP